MALTDEQVEKLAANHGQNITRQIFLHLQHLRKAGFKSELSDEFPIHELTDFELLHLISEANQAGADRRGMLEILQGERQRRDQLLTTQALELTSRTTDAAQRTAASAQASAKAGKWAAIFAAVAAAIPALLKLLEWSCR